MTKLASKYLNVGAGSTDVAAGDHSHADLHAAATVSGNGIGIDGQEISLDIGTGETDVAAGDHTHEGYAPAAEGVTNGDSHDHAGGDGAQIGVAGILPTEANVLIGTDGTAEVDAYTKLLLHCDGVDGSQVFTDSSPSGHTVTANGNAQVDTAQSKFGGASLLLPGNGNYLEVPGSDDFAPGTGDFTVDLWIRYNSGTTDTNPFVYGNATDTRLRMMYYWPDPTTYGLGLTVGGTSYYFGAGGISTGNWYHIAFVRQTGTLHCYVNGTEQGAGTAAAGDVSRLASDYVRIGRGYGETTNYVDGWIDEVRFSNTARWTSNFTPPTAAYAPPTQAQEIPCTEAGRNIIAADDAAAQREALELGDSATKDIGTGSTDVAAGDHSHADLHAAATVSGNGIGIDGQEISLDIGTGSTDVAAGDHSHAVLVFAAGGGGSYDKTLGSDHTYCGDITTENVGESVVFGDVLYFNWADGEYKKAANTAAATLPAVVIALESKGDGEACKLLRCGFIRDDSWTFAASIICTGTGGAPTSTAPTASGTFVQRIGQARAASVMWFNPSSDVVEVP